MKIEGDLHGTDISGVYDTKRGLIRVKQIETVFFVRYKDENYQIRNSPRICYLSGIGVMNCYGEGKHIFLQTFFGITDPISVIGIFMLTFAILRLASWKILSAWFILSVSVIITICVAVITFCATFFSARWRDERKTMEKVIQGLLEKQS